jgi:hypothetical protein
VRACQRASVTGASATIWLMLKVPMTMLGAPGSAAPMPSAAAATSCAPATTGVPGRSPVSAAADAVTAPAGAALGRTGGSNGARSANPKSSRASRDQVWVLTSVQ